MTLKVEKNVPLAPLTFYGVGGVANELYTVEAPEAMAEVWAETVAEKIPKLILGKGSNLLLSDKGFRGRVFVLQCGKIQWQGNVVTVDAGCPWQRFVEETNTHGYADMCNLSGIPGTVGGFIRGNAGAFGLETAEKVKQVEYVDEHGNVQTLRKDACEFRYRESVFKSHPDWCVLRGVFEMTEQADPNESLEHSRKLMADRWKKYPPGKSGGSFFKNPPGDYAGRLLEEAGAKGDRVGGAEMAEIHANFIRNLGEATQEDILALARKWQGKVQEQFGVTLEPEVMILDESGQKINL